ncbi:carboxymuconolactone decarboxylase family protein [Pseudomonas sp. MWU16-30317]|uniref:CMD domain-containing protein n=1 Tax=Pseudomonas sp. MWU16-30317 TaxID=2878095 RepID=UPI001CF94A81|nr:carboxymuconolactone decarboxylase family protein [Pseudomonas sp. MWU16-30317]
MTFVESTTEPDVLDTLLHIAPGSPVHAARQFRNKVLAATQSSYELFFAAEVADGLSQAERLLVAYHACLLTPQPLLAAHYLERLEAIGVSAEQLSAVATGAIEALGEPRLQAVLAFTGTLIKAPVEGDRHALIALSEAGLSTPEIVTLAQLVAFMSYQVRLASGLLAMQSAGVA